MTLQEPCKLSLQAGTGWAMCCLAQWKTGFALPGTTFRVRQLSWDSTLALLILYAWAIPTYRVTMEGFTQERERYHFVQLPLWVKLSIVTRYSTLFNT